LEKQEILNMKNMTMKRRILITGDCGFIGTHLSKKLDEMGYTARGFDIVRNTTEDVRNILSAEAMFDKFRPDTVIHLAALARTRQSLPYHAEYYETNITGTHNILKLAENYKIRRFLFASSSSIYGDSECPLREDMVCDKQTSPYAMSKIVGEMLCKMFSNVPTIAFRPFTVYGDGNREEMVTNKLIRAGITGETFYKYGNGESIRGYTNVRDLVDGIAMLIEYEGKLKDNFEVFNLGGMELIKLNDFVELIKEKFPNLKVEQMDRHPIDAFESYADITKAEKLLNWKPKRDFKTEIRRLLSEL